MTFYASADEPKRPKNGFIRYSIKHRAELLKKYPYKDNRTISKLLGIRWKKMTAEEKQPYVWARELVYLFCVWECVCVWVGGGGGGVRTLCHTQVWAVHSATLGVRCTHPHCEMYAETHSVWDIRSVTLRRCEPYAVWAVRSVSRTQCHLLCEPYAVPPAVWAVRSVSRTQCHPQTVWAVRRSTLSVKSRTQRHPQNWPKILLLGLVSTSGRSSTTTSTRSGARTPNGATHPPSDPPRSSSTPWTRGCDQGKKSAPRRVLSLLGSFFRMCARTLSVSCDSTRVFGLYCFVSLALFPLPPWQS